jgi:hypothetical protein
MRLSKADRRTRYRTDKDIGLTGFFNRAELRNARESERRYREAERRHNVAYRVATGTSTREEM